MNERIHADMFEATRLTRAGHLLEATALIQRVLRGEPVADTATDTTAGHADTAGRRAPCIIDAVAETVDFTDAQGVPRAEQPAESPPPDRQSDRHKRTAAVPPVAEALTELWDRLHRDGAGQGLKGLTFPSRPIPAQAPDVVPEGGQFVTKSYTNQAGTRAYKLYIPSGYRGQPLPLIVMLHGCTQTPDDFAAGTRMNALAEEHGCFVVYPAQASSANVSKCWKWFSATDQHRGQGEPSIIAGITRQVISTYSVDTQQVYIAGMSAGGAMAAIMGATYPELYAAVGVHSGLRHGSAGDLPSAFAAMQQGAAAPERHPGGVPGAASPRQVVPTIVFHGDGDTTVHPYNGDQVIGQWASTMTEAGASPQTEVQRGRAPGGHAYTRTLYADARGQAILEQWLVHGAGHAWSGGSPSGSYTDPKGPDAAREMLRFFFEHPHRTAAVYGKH